MFQDETMQIELQEKKKTSAKTSEFKRFVLKKLWSLRLNNKLCFEKTLPTRYWLLIELICSCPHVWAAAASLYLVIDDVMSSLISHWLLRVYMRVRAQLLLLDSPPGTGSECQTAAGPQRRWRRWWRDYDGGPLPLLCPQRLSWRWVSVSCVCHMKTLHISKQAVYWQSGLNNKQTNKQTNSSWTLCVFSLQVNMRTLISSDVQTLIKSSCLVWMMKFWRTWT